MADGDPVPQISSADQLKAFNEFQAQSRQRAEATIKLVLLVSGSMLTLTVGAVMGKQGASIPPDMLPSLKWGWGFLFGSILASLSFMTTMVLATFHQGLKWNRLLHGSSEDVVVDIKTWNWLRGLNAVLGLLAILFCVIGVALMACVAVAVADVHGVAAPTFQVSPSSK